MLKVSVCVVTYNHEKFVAKMLESILMQQTTFDFEIIVGDDLSKDGTRSILQAYQKQYPDKIRLLLHDKNLGLNGKFNALATFAAAKGEYIAQFDGDDYLTSPHKLQRQVEMLDANPHYTASFHNAEVIYDDNAAPPYLVNWIKKPEFYVEDLIGEDELCFIATSSLMFRREDFAKHPDPEWTNLSTSGDIPRNIMLAKRGPIGYIDEVMSVYRKNRGGASFADNHYGADFLFNRIQMYSNINKELNYEYDDRLKKNIATYYYKLLFSREYKDRYWPKLKFALKYLKLAQPEGDTRKAVLRDHIIPPILMRIYSYFAIGMYQLRK
ncbi:glycosyltransferase involved in cell wall biosynthesis [Dyadobacter jejuensis]|uniref:Glycosyltransferase involved in cell wall biosynthesis n=1 Tax=Dyadobacter jejuensis TaxID=1082580 RepID=A0A316ASG0_9BACT|nr:glycosyltransferase family 2 protein [Dyadobacter jejuensis]PWJ60633.1 glycosyltransferase involved in cell wall biosynthesis [Dyadobacter jejuensis]